MFLRGFGLRRFDDRIMLGDHMACLSFFYYFSRFGVAFLYSGSNFSSCRLRDRLIFFTARKVTHIEIDEFQKGG